MTTLEVALVGYVVRPEHIHLLIGEPEHGTPSTVMRVLKQRVELPSEEVVRGENPQPLDSKVAGWLIRFPGESVLSFRWAPANSITIKPFSRFS
jgi:REP element-mobilizing transposase RayT